MLKFESFKSLSPTSPSSAVRQSSWADGRGVHLSWNSRVRRNGGAIPFNVDQPSAPSIHRWSFFQNPMAPRILPSSTKSMKLPRHWILLASPGSPIVCPPRIEFAFSKCLAVDEILWRPAAIGVRASIGNNIGNTTNVHHESTRPSAAPTKPPPPAWSRRRPRRRRRRPIAGRSGQCLGHVAAHLACVWAVSGQCCLSPGLCLGRVWAI